MPTTSQVLPEDFRNYFTEQAKAGNDVLYLSFTSKLSGTYELGRMILKEVKEEYPDFNCVIVDSLQSGGPIGLVADPGAKALSITARHWTSWRRPPTLSGLMFIFCLRCRI